MQFIADFHIHSKYSRAVSIRMVLEELDAWADDKGILVMGTGDFTHPEWMAEIKEKLEPAEPGLYKLKKEFKKKTMKDTFAETRFMLTVEISSIYSRNGKTRRIHNLVFVPDIKTAEEINTQLSWIGNLKSDGRPILGLDAEELAKIVFETNENAVLIPAHAWTPWFSVFGSMSGFDTIKECFGKYADKIFAIETGLSSDPAMNWRLSMLDDIALISNSDSHSLERIGREANIFDTKLSYDGIMNAIKSRDPKQFIATIEFFPEEGKYHYDGHRNCEVSWNPEETKKNNAICSVCNKKVTVGVMNRVDVLADREEIETKENPFGEARARVYENRIPFVSLIPLDEIIGDAVGVGPKSKTVKKEYEKLIKAFGSELRILIEISQEEIAKVVRPEIAEAIDRVRSHNVQIIPGYDGEYGKIKVFGAEQKIKQEEQTRLF
jgi:DNA helicase II / ATP-dependent DNA helicase PcrA